MPRRYRLSPTETLERYNPALGLHALFTPTEWSAIGGFVRDAARHFTRPAGKHVRDYLRAMTKLTIFAFRLDGALTLDVVLAPSTIRTFLANFPTGARDEALYLWRLAPEHGSVAPEEPVRIEVGRRPLKPPHSPGEVEILLAAARAQGTKLRRSQLFAVVVLGAGCGLVRQRARDATVADVHAHDEGTFIWATGSCSKVRSAFEDHLTELLALRPTGPSSARPRRQGQLTYQQVALDVAASRTVNLKT